MRTVWKRHLSSSSIGDEKDLSRSIQTILALKLKQYYGTLRISAIARISTIITYLLIIFSAAGAAILMRGLYGIAGIEDLPRIITAIAFMFSTLFIFEIYLGMKGGITALRSEVDFILPSPIKPSTYLIADLIFQLIFLNVILTPAVSTFMATLLYPDERYLLTFFIFYEISILMAVIIAHILGILNVKGYGRITKILGWTLITFMLIPIILNMLDMQARSIIVFHPSEILARLAVGAQETLDIPLLVICLAVILGSYLQALRIKIFSDVNPLLTTGFMEPSSRWTKFPYLKLDFSKGSLHSYLIKFHLIRICRDGSLGTSMLFLAVFVAANMSLSRIAWSSLRPELASTILTALYIPLIPALLTINWNVTERMNLWSPASSSNGLRSYLDGMLLSYIIVSTFFAIGFYTLMNIMIGENPFMILDLFLALTTSITSSAISMLMVLRSKKPAAALSHLTLLYTMIPMAGSMILDLPLLIIRALESLATNPPPSLLAFLITYPLLLFLILRQGILSASKNLAYVLGNSV